MSEQENNPERIRINKDGTEDRLCPKCGEWATAEFEYTGFGWLQITPYSCECGWSQGYPEEIDIDDDD